MNRLLACRVCLAYDTRLCSIMDGQFRDIYEKLVETSLDTEEMLPTTVCYICFSSMKKMLQFRDRSQKANQILHQMISSGLEPSISSLNMLVKDKTGLSWNLGIFDVERTNTTSVEDEIKVEIESVKSEMDIDGMSDRDEDYSDRMPVCRESTSDSEDDLPLQNISEQCKTDRVKIEVILEEISGHEGAAPPPSRKLDNNEAENELVNIQAPLIKTEKDEVPRQKKEDKKKIPGFEEESKKNKSLPFIENDTITPPKDIFTCDLCNNEYQCKILLESHMKTSHVLVLNRKDSISSDLNVTNKFKSKVQEIQNYNRKENSRRVNKNRDNTSQYDCQYCMKRFSCISNFTNHLRVHTKEKPFKCHICEKVFSQSGNLIRHLRVHTQEKPFKCNICQKGFSISSHLTRHLTVHTKEKPFKCDVCEKCFSIRSHLTRHLTTVHTNEKPFKCDVCEKCFSEKGNLTTHLRVHTKEKPFKCDVCGKSFSQNEHLTRHLRVHTKEKPFKCDICEKGFTQSNALNKHLRVHNKEKPKNVSEFCANCSFK